MSVNFQGNTDTILQSNLLKTIGYATNSLLLYAMNSEKVLSLTDFLNWAKSNDELDKMVRTLTNETITLENFIMQLYYATKKMYTTGNMLPLHLKPDQNFGAELSSFVYINQLINVFLCLSFLDK